MAKVIGYDESLKKRFTCRNCTAIVEYAPNEDKYTEKTDEGSKIKGLHCPSCAMFYRTNH